MCVLSLSRSLPVRLSLSLLEPCLKAVVDLGFVLLLVWTHAVLNVRNRRWIARGVFRWQRFVPRRYFRRFAHEWSRKIA